MKKRSPFLFFIFLSPLALSAVSQFHLISPFPMTFDIATMLTPVGIVKNYLWQETILTPFYMQNITQTGRDHTYWIYGVIFLQISGALFFLQKIKASK